MGVALPAAVERRNGAWPIVVCPARLVEMKGHRFLLEAWRILRERGFTASCGLRAMANSGPNRIFCGIFGLQNSVKFLGTLPHEELLRIYKEVPSPLSCWPAWIWVMVCMKEFRWL